jgi:leucyl-tRNA---protein transferase
MRLGDTPSIHPPTRKVLPTIPPELVVYDADEACPYLPDRIARRPLRMPTRRLTRAEFGERLASGDRRTGFFLYTQECATCRACEPLRVDVPAFVPSRSQSRARKRGDRELTVELGPYEVDEERVLLFGAHQHGRGLSRSGTTIDARGYEAFLVDSCVDGFELRYRFQGRLVGIAITDRAEDALSAVYTYFDPELPALSIGTYSILRQIQLAADYGLPWVYLGLAIEESPHMRYKQRFVPHERRILGEWKRFEAEPASGHPALDSKDPRG